MRDPDFFLRKYAGTTTRFCFYDMPLTKLEPAFYKRAQEMNALYAKPWTVFKEEIKGSFVEKLHRLLPLASPIATKQMILETRSNWTMLLENRSHSGATDPGQAAYMARMLKARFLSCALTEDVRGGKPGSAQFVLYDYPKSDNSIRSIAAHKESKWEFYQSGTPLPFEETEQYLNRKIKNRLTFEMIERYCSHIGIDLFNTDFYEGDACLIHTYAIPSTVYTPEFPNAD